MVYFYNWREKQLINKKIIIIDIFYYYLIKKIRILTYVPKEDNQLNNLICVFYFYYLIQLEKTLYLILDYLINLFLCKYIQIRQVWIYDSYYKERNNYYLRDNESNNAF